MNTDADRKWSPRNTLKTRKSEGEDEGGALRQRESAGSPRRCAPRDDGLLRKELIL